MKMKDCPTSVRHRISDDYEPEPGEEPTKLLAKHKILLALKDGPKTSKEIIEITGFTKRTVYVNTLNMSTNGEIVAVKIKVPGRFINLWSDPKVPR